jgi:hypothetical protein
MEKSVLNISPENFYITKKLFEYDFTFLNDMFTIDICPYYNLILSRELYKIKNLYSYLYLRTLKLNYKYSKIPILENNKCIKSPEEFNTIILNYIQKSKLHAVIVMNSIQQFYIPLFNQ